jgi:hypothetical protein
LACSAPYVFCSKLFIGISISQYLSGVRASIFLILKYKWTPQEMILLHFGVWSIYLNVWDTDSWINLTEMILPTRYRKRSLNARKLGLYGPFANSPVLALNFLYHWLSYTPSLSQLTFLQMTRTTGKVSWDSSDYLK